jgi:signal transduction histidine kinase
MMAIAALLLENARLRRELAAAEAAVRRNADCLAEEERLSRTGSWSWSAADGKMEWSRESFRLLGHDSAGGRPSLLRFLRGVHRGDRPMALRILAYARAEKRDFELDLRYLCHARGTLQLRIEGQAQTEEGVGFRGFRGFLLDVTEQRRTEERVQGQKEAIRMALNALLEDLNLDRFLNRIALGISREFRASTVQLWPFDSGGPGSCPIVTLHNGHSFTTASLPSGPPVQHETYWFESEILRGPKVFDLLHVRVENPRFGFLIEQGVRQLLVIPLMQGERCLGCLEVQFRQAQHLTANDLDMEQTLVHHATLALTLSRLARRVEQAAITEERNRVARDIHDTLAQAFAGIALHAESLMNGNEVIKSDSGRSLACIHRLAKTGLDEARRSLRALRPRDLEGNTLPGALEAATAAITAEGNLSGHFWQDGEAEDLPDEVQSELFRIAQEALTNVRKHAMAKNVSVRLKYARNQVSLRICDDGIGLPVMAPGRSSRGYGLATMRERAQRIGGTFRLRRVERGGTAIHITVAL